MPVPSETIWNIEPHTLAKHKILERYLQAWYPILNTYNRRIIYLDGFCGPGCYSGGEPGSPIIAIDTALTHRSKMVGEVVFVFIDERKDRIENLRSELARRKIPADFKVHAQHGRFDEVVGSILDGLDSEHQNLAPTFAFVDPFGFSGVPFAVLRRLLRNPKCEVFVTFMVDAMNRFLDGPDEEIRAHIADFFGSSEILEASKEAGNRKTYLLNAYKNRLSDEACFVREFEMCNRNDRVIYYLLFATNNALGHLKMKEAMWKVDGEGDYKFSDKTNPEQIVLFRQDHSRPLYEDVQKRFTNSKRQMQEVITYVCDETPYVVKRLRQALRDAEARGWIQVDQLKVDGQRRKRGTFPDDAVINFQ
ncbi:MAG TPA: hypothetical protein DEP53_19775 [Bacteroidetes bacterium]|nr:hypothetical protein [Bacteroidota bacterium]